MNTNTHSIVIGGSIVGVCCALALQREGHIVTLIDPAPAGESTAKWSCGQMALSEIIPLSKKGVLAQIPKWLLDRNGPLDLHTAAIPSFLPWFLRFIACARTAKITHIAEALATLTHQAFADYQTLFPESAYWLGSKAAIELFDNQSDLLHEQPYIDLRKELGFQLETLSAKDIGDLEPTIAGKFQHGVLLKDWTAVRDTEGLITALTEHFITQGGNRILSKANDLIGDEQRISAVRLENGQALSSDNVVLAAGIGSRRFFKRLGIAAPLKPIVGYQVLLPTPEIELNHSLIYFNGGFLFTPLSRGLQIGGGIQFAPDNAPPNFKRADQILHQATRIIPELNVKAAQYGVGYRPFLPDTKPVIDLAPQHKNVALAFGHGQLGLTLGATTGRLVADLLNGHETKTDMMPFRASRY